MKLHWFCYTYSGLSLVELQRCEACTYSGQASKRITRKIINDHKEAAGVTSGAVLIAAIYLGEMTREEFTGEDNNETP